MKVSQVEQDHKRSHVIEQLAKYDFTDIEELTYKELRHKLAMARAMEDVDNE